MLVISRKPDQGLVLTVPPSAETTTLEIVIVRIRGSNCRVGINAPDAVRIRRSELVAQPPAPDTAGVPHV